MDAVENATKCATSYRGGAFIIEKREFDDMRLALAAEKKRSELVDEFVAASGDFVRWLNASKVHSPGDVEFMVKRMVLAKSNLDAFDKERGV